MKIPLACSVQTVAKIRIVNSSLMISPYKKSVGILVLGVFLRIQKALKPSSPSSSGTVCGSFLAFHRTKRLRPVPVEILVRFQMRSSLALLTLQQIQSGNNTLK